MSYSNSILLDTKKRLGLTPDYTYFDDDIIMAINSAFLILNQLGIGDTSSVFKIEDIDTEWTDFIDEDDPCFGVVPEYIFMKVRQQFDPPQSNILKESLNACISEYEWRMMEAHENYDV